MMNRSDHFYFSDEVIKLGSHNIVTWLAFHYCRIKLEQSFELDQKVAKGSEEIELI
jgi:hypothetical protein